MWLFGQYPLLSSMKELLWLLKNQAHSAWKAVSRLMINSLSSACSLCVSGPQLVLISFSWTRPSGLISRLITDSFCLIRAELHVYSIRGNISSFTLLILLWSSVTFCLDTQRSNSVNVKVLLWCSPCSPRLKWVSSLKMDQYVPDRIIISVCFSCRY